MARVPIADTEDTGTSIAPSRWWVDRRKLGWIPGLFVGKPDCVVVAAVRQINGRVDRKHIDFLINQILQKIYKDVSSDRLYAVVVSYLGRIDPLPFKLDRRRHSSVA